MVRRAESRDVAFRVIDDHLERIVAFPDRPERDYTHRCPRAAFERIAHAAEELTEGFTLEMLSTHEELPWTQVAVALDFLKERGIIDTRSRKNHAATGSVHLDAMTEYFALAECPQAD